MKILKEMRRALGRLSGPPRDQATDTFLRYCRRKWPGSRLVRRNSVILVGETPWRPSICSFAILANYLADLTRSKIDVCFFGRRKNLQVDAAYGAFGAQLSLTWTTAKPFEARAREISAKVISSLREKRDVFAISVAGVPVGDLIYDTYLRYYLVGTVDLEDERLHELIMRGIQIGMTCEDYFSKNEVKAYLAYDAPYIESGIVHRFAIDHDVPVYTVLYSPFSVHRMDHKIRGDRSDHRSWPSKTGASLHDRSEFSALTRDEQHMRRRQARERLEARLSGKVERRLLPRGDTAFGAPSEQSILRPSDRPKILIMLHDFCDAPNILRWSLFEDFEEWLQFLLPRAVKTGFDWYVKPHPHRHEDDRKAIANQLIVERFKAQYPEITFLDPTVSNRQIISEGITAMFTVHGTAGHEFAYLGLPVVNAGYNHHINYSFNIHARSREEYESLIARADMLQVQIDPAEIEEFFYTHFLAEYPHSSVHLTPAAWLDNASLAALESTSEVYAHFVAEDSPERDRAVKSYLDQHFSNDSTEHHHAIR